MSRALTWLPWGRIERHVPHERRPIVWLPAHTADAMLQDALAWKDLETGGMLLGYRVNREIVVESTIGSGPRARHGRFSFTPDGRWQQVGLARIYDASGRMQTYLGDWHSHPRGGLGPSRRDLRTARHVAATADSQTRNPLTLLLAPERADWWVGAWVLDGGLFVRARVRRIEHTEPTARDTDRPVARLATPRTSLSLAI